MLRKYTAKGSEIVLKMSVTLNTSISIINFLDPKEKKQNCFDVAFRVNLLGQVSSYSSDVVDALMLNWKENAHYLNIQLFVKVCSILYLAHTYIGANV